jgi:hypothetical protein
MGPEIFVPISFFATIVLIVYIYYSNRNKERMALIEKGQDAGIFKSKNRPVYLLTFKLGFFLIGLGIGLLIGNILAASTRLEEEVAYFSMILLFGGISLIIYHLLEKRIIQKYQNPE